MTTQPTSTGYAPINGLDMYYEIHGDPAAGGVPLVLLHGALSATGTSFGALLGPLTEGRPGAEGRPGPGGRRIIAVEQQAHGHTADIDRPLSVEQMGADTIALLDHIGVAQADFFGYSLGAGIAAHIAVQRPAIVRRLVLASIATNNAGFHPGVLDGIDMLRPEMLAGTPFEAEYQQIAPRPEDFAVMVAKVKDLDGRLPEMAEETFAGISAPTLLVFGDSDIIRPEHGVELFRLLGGGVAGDNVGLPASRLAILPGTTHITVPYQVDILVPVITSFLSN
jgi:pimeloyl-ACP methyl ester carboxylesterase